MDFVNLARLFIFTLWMIDMAAFGQSERVLEMRTGGECSPIVQGTEKSVRIELTCTDELTDVQIGQLVDAIIDAISLVLDTPLPTDPFHICVVDDDGGSLTVSAFTFPNSDIAKTGDGGTFIQFLSKLPGVTDQQVSESSIFRYADEGKITLESGTPLGRGNEGVLIVPDSTIRNSFNGDEHLAFTYIRSVTNDLCS